MTLFPLVGAIYCYAYLVFSKIYSTYILKNLQTITFSLEDITHLTLSFMTIALTLVPSILGMIFIILSAKKDGIRALIPPYNYDKYRYVWNIFLFSLFIILLLFPCLWYKNPRFIKPYDIFILLGILFCNYLLFSSLNKHLKIYINKHLVIDSSSKNM